MKTFKFLSNTALVFSLVMLASCSSDNDFDAENEAKTTARKIEFKANIVLGDSTDVTRATLESDNNVTWDENDQILVFCDNAEQAVTFGRLPLLLTMEKCCHCGLIHGLTITHYILMLHKQHSFLNHIV